MLLPPPFSRRTSCFESSEQTSQTEGQRMGREGGEDRVKFGVGPECKNSENMQNLHRKESQTSDLHAMKLTAPPAIEKK